MENVSNSAPESIFFASGVDLCKTFYAVYDCCISDNIPSQDVAFIEERLQAGNDHVSSDEKCFGLLSEAQAYVRDHFKAGAEYSGSVC